MAGDIGQPVSRLLQCRMGGARLIGEPVTTQLPRRALPRHLLQQERDDMEPAELGWQNGFI